jgi:hypothetical protein
LQSYSRKFFEKWTYFAKVHLTLGNKRTRRLRLKLREGDIENVNNVLKITQIRVKYHLKVPREKTEEAKEAFMAAYKLYKITQKFNSIIN